MSPELWPVLKDVGTVGIALLSLCVAVTTAVASSRWRPKPFLQFRFDETSGHFEHLDANGFLDRAKISKYGVLVMNINDLLNQPKEDPSADDQQMRRGQLITIVNHGSGPAFDVEIHLDIPEESSAAKHLLGDLVVVRRAQMLPGDTAEFIITDDLKFGTAVKGVRRWEGLDVWGVGVQHDVEALIAWGTWREPPKNHKLRRRDFSYDAHSRMGDWI